MISIIFIFLASNVFAENSINHFDLKKTVKAHTQARSYLEWHSSEFHPHEVVDKLEELNFNDSLIIELCNSLELLPQEDQRLFYSELLKYRARLESSCIGNSFIKIDKEIKDTQNTSDVMVYNMRLFAEELAGPRQNLAQPNSTHPMGSLGPSKIVNLDTLGGPEFYYGVKGGLELGEYALTFDDGPHPVLTDMLLNVLASENIKATFFMVGQNARRYPEIVKRVLALGHTIATHSYSHKDLSKLDHTSAENEIIDGFKAAQQAVDMVAPFFRFPYGAKSSYLRDYLKINDIASFFWDVDTLDWKKKNYDDLLNYALEQTHKARRGIILFHDIQPQTIGIMPQFLRELKKSGYKTVNYEPKEWMERLATH